MLNRFYWIGLKSQPSSFSSRRNRSGQLTEHIEAIRENLLRAAEVLAHIGEQPAQLLLTEGK
jgi:hypothetical protein